MEESARVPRPASTFATRRRFLHQGSLAAASLLAPNPFAWTQAGPSPAADYRLEIAESEWELSPRKKIRTAMYNGQIPGPLLRVTEGKPVTIEILNRLKRPEIVHWHGQWIPVEVDGATEEGSP